MKICKRITVIALTVLMIIPLVTAMNSSAFVVIESHDAKKEGKGQYSYGDLTYNIINDEAVIMYSPSASGKVTIPDKIDNYKVTQIADYAFYNNSKITSISIGKNVWRIGDYAFDHCLEVEAVTMGSSVEEIGEYAFHYCSYVNSITLPKGIMRLGCGFIQGTDYYLAAKWTGNALYIDNYLVEVKDNISGTFTIKEGTTCIADGAFRDCTKLTGIKIPDSVIAVGGFSFDSCIGLTSVTIPNSVKYIHDYAFQDCKNLSSVNMGSSVLEIGFLAFNGTKCVTKENKIYYVGKYLLDTDTDISGKVTVKEGTLGIAERAFCDRVNVTEVVLPKSLRSISSVAFSGMNALDKINIPASLIRAGGDAFRYGKKNLKVYVEDIAAWCGISFENFDANPFRKNNSVWTDKDGKTLTELTIPEGVKSIGAYCFYNCDFLKKIIIPDSVTTMGDGCFNECNLKTLVIACNEGSAAQKYAAEKGITTAPSCEHRFTNYISNNDLGCDTDGTATALCDNGCGKSDTKVTEKALGHSFTEYIPNNDLSCTTDGTATAVCDNGCGKKDTKVITKAPGHSFGEWQIITKPSFDAEGRDERTCEVCGELEVRVTNKLPAFSDVKSGAWYYNAIAYATQNGYMNGMSETTFAPNGNIKREQFVLILANIAGVDTSSYKNTSSGMTDVPTGQWYSGAVAWAVKEGYVSGMTPTTFGRGKDITRAQLARLFYVYAEKNGIDVKGRAELSRFADAGKVQDWMRDGLCWAVDKGIISGMQVDGKLCLVPTGTATRAQTAVMLMKFEDLK